MKKRVMLLIACGLTASLSQAATYTSFGTGLLVEATNWNPVYTPASGDANQWLIADGKIRTAGAKVFYGQTLTVQNGTVRPNVATAALLTMNNLVLNGGNITTRNSGTATGSFTIDLSQDGSAGTFTLNSGNLQNADLAGSDLIFRNGALAGSGTINIVKTVAADTRVWFQDTINPVDFTGVFNVTTGVLDLPTIAEADASFGLTIAAGGKLYNDANIAVKNLTLGTTSFANGTYTVATDLAAYSAYFSNPTGTQTITVIPEPATIGMLGLGALITLLFRRMQIH